MPACTPFNQATKRNIQSSYQKQVPEQRPRADHHLLNPPPLPTSSMEVHHSITPCSPAGQRKGISTHGFKLGVAGCRSDGPAEDAAQEDGAHQGEPPGGLRPVCRPGLSQPRPAPSPHAVVPAAAHSAGFLSFLSVRRPGMGPVRGHECVVHRSSSDVSCGLES